MNCRIHFGGHLLEQGLALGVVSIGDDDVEAPMEAVHDACDHGLDRHTVRHVGVAHLRARSRGCRMALGLAIGPPLLSHGGKPQARHAGQFEHRRPRLESAKSAKPVWTAVWSPGCDPTLTSPGHYYSLQLPVNVFKIRAC